MSEKQDNPLTGCVIIVVGSFALLFLLRLAVKSCCSSTFHVELLTKKLAGVFTGIVFWAVVFFLLSGRKK